VTAGFGGWYLNDVRCPRWHPVGEVYQGKDGDLVLVGHRPQKSGRPGQQGAQPLSGAGQFDGYCVVCRRGYPGDKSEARAAALAGRYDVLRRTASM
jgi:hypothetical protein